MNAQTLELVTAAARILANHPDSIRVEEMNGTYMIEGHPDDMGAIMGRQGKHAAAIGFLAQQLEPAAVVRVAAVDRTNDVARPAVPVVTRVWNRHDESQLRGLVERLLKLIYPEASAVFQPGVRESIYTIPSKRVLSDVVGALHILFRAWGRRHDRFVTITVPSNESASV